MILPTILRSREPIHHSHRPSLVSTRRRGARRAIHLDSRDNRALGGKFTVKEMGGGCALLF
jgi:hypothetical protein